MTVDCAIASCVTRPRSKSCSVRRRVCSACSADRCAACSASAAWRLPLLLGSVSFTASATNRCTTPGGKILYTDETCESVGAKHDREVKATVSAIGTAPAPSKSGNAKLAAKNTRLASVFKKSPKAPVLFVCYDPKDGRKDVTHDEIDSAIRYGIQL